MRQFVPDNGLILRLRSPINLIYFLACFSLSRLTMSSTVKSSSDSKRSHLPHQTKLPDQYRTQIPQLQELFPSWSVEGLS